MELRKIIIPTIVELIIIIVILIINICNVNALGNYQVCDSGLSFQSAIKEDLGDIIVLKAPLSGEKAEDPKHYLRDEFNINEEHILYVSYCLQKYIKDTDSEGDTDYKWEDFGREDYYSNKVFIYDDIRMNPLICYDFEPFNQVYYYPNGEKGRSKVGDIRYLIKYVTNEDTISFLAKAENGYFKIEQMQSGSHLVVNGDIKDIRKNVFSSGKTFLIASLFIYAIFVFHFIDSQRTI